MKKSALKEYAKLLIRKGLNVQKGQNVVVICELDQPQFVCLVVDEAYKCGAKRVFVEWNCQKKLKLDYKHRSLKSLGSLESFEIERLRWRSEKLPATLYLISESPDGLDGVKQEKITRSKADLYPQIKPFRDAMEGKYQWCIAAVPGVDWSKKVFPNATKSAALEKMWSLILSSARAEGDSINNWQQHNEQLKKRCDYLNSLNLDRLCYKNSKGTNLTVGLNENGRFLGGEEKTLSNIIFNPNIPSEEVYTTPNYARADGIVYSTKPLSYEGQLIENFYLEFSNGVVINAKAEKNEQMLLKMLELDEGAKRLGECALVPFDNPINNSNTLFYETLFDENASCHFALGRGFIESYKGYEDLTLDELYEKGVNRSMIHVDFMIGTDDLEIIGYDKDSKETKIFNNGNWARQL